MPVGSFALVLHTHLPWVAHHGAWPVGEEWLHQAWATSYDQVLDLLHTLAAEGRTDQVTLGVTPILAAQWDDPYCLDQQHTWLGFWAERAAGMAATTGGDLAADEYRAATTALQRFEQHWSRGGSAVLRPLVEAGVVDLLSGPATHPFQPLLAEPVADLGLRTGLLDTAMRVGAPARGIWAPECGYTPGLESLYSRHGIEHLMMDGPAFDEAGATTALGHPIADSDVVAFGRDLSVAYRVWSPTHGYPRGPWYRDFHTYEHDWGFRHSRVTDPTSPDKQPYRPDRARAAVAQDARDFVSHVRARLVEQSERIGRPGLVVAAFDTELFGHWWHEGPQWLGEVLRQLPTAGVDVTTLAGARRDGLVGEPIAPLPSSWGAGKKYHTWAGEQVADIVADNDHLQQVVGKVLTGHRPRLARSPVLDQLARSMLLALASDWAFMITKDSAAEYARRRHFFHHSDAHRLADTIERFGANSVPAFREASEQQAINGPFGHLDARWWTGD